jgi:hypothetical protein
MKDVTRPRRALALTCFVLAVLGLVLLVRLVADAPAPGSAVRGGVDTDAGPSQFGIQGTAQRISPGVSAPIDVEFINWHFLPVSVAELVVVIEEIDAPNADRDNPCTLDDFRVLQVAHSVEINLPPRKTSTLSSLALPSTTWPQIGMHNRPTNQDGCKGTTLTLAYTASGSFER